MARIAASPLSAVSTSYPSLESSAFNASRIPLSSSTISTRPAITAPSAILVSWCLGGDHSLRQGQRDRELGPAPRFAHHIDGTLVRLDDLARIRHAEPGALLLGGEERVEDAIDLVGRDAAAIVAHAHHGATAAVFDEQIDAPALGERLERVDGVVEHVGEHLLQLLLV